jgi:hypothetical protein
MNKTIAVVAFLVVFAFLSILVIHVPRVDLIAVITLTMALACWDLYTTCFAKKG